MIPNKSSKLNGWIHKPINITFIRQVKVFYALSLRSKQNERKSLTKKRELVTREVETDRLIFTDFFYLYIFIGSKISILNVAPFYIKVITLYCKKIT